MQVLEAEAEESHRLRVGFPTTLWESSGRGRLVLHPERPAEKMPECFCGKGGAELSVS